jgi:signal-transduction protein with cAMP-binding, CBS, and nucleotidyltransferase domain
MTAPVVTVDEQTSLRTAMELLVGRHIGAVPVMRGRTVVGIVSITDLLAFTSSLARIAAPDDDELPPSWDGRPGPLSESEPSGAQFTELWKGEDSAVDIRMEAGEPGESSALDELTVSEIMTEQLCIVRPKDSILAATRLMSEAGVHRLLVIEHGELVGVLSTLDIVRAVAAKRL